MYEVLAVDAIPVSSLVIPASSLLADPISLSAISFDARSVIRIAHEEDAANTVVMIAGMRGSIKDDESDSVAGRIHTVTLTADVNESSASTRSSLRRLESRAHALLLYFRDGRMGLVQCDRDSYLTTVARGETHSSIQMRIQDLLGIQWVE